VPAKAIIFDFDGVIVDSEPMHQTGLKAAVESLGMSFGDAPVNGVWSGRYIGLDDRACFRMICEENNRPFTTDFFEHLSALKRNAVQHAFNDGLLNPFPGVLDLIRAAASAVPIAICSGARRHEIEPLVERFNVRHLFQTIVSADEVRIAKPDPEGYRKACEILNVAPHEAVTIEDSPRGIAAAKAAGVRVIAVGHSFKQERLTQADEFIKAVGDLKLEHLLA
jgi:beta-phosphoglucomutase